MKKNGIELLDCTLRDGGHLTNSFFGEDVIKDIIRKLVDASLDVVEVGFLRDCSYNSDYAQFNNIKEASRVLPKNKKNTKFALLVQEDQYDDSKLEQCDGTIEIVRVSFHDYDLQEGLDFANRIVAKGYKVFINPINLQGYSDEQLLDIIKKVNDICPYALTIVDTFGSLIKRDLVRLISIIDHNLAPNINMAIHLHENQSLSYSLAQTFIELKPPIRNICIDGSLYGMGRVPGNLCIELIMEYMNRTQGTQYDVEPVYDAIDEYIMEIKRKNPWGYSIAYALSAQHHVHRTFAEYLLEKGTLQTKQINQILSMIEPDRKTRWNQEYIEQLYIDYQKKEIDDDSDIKAIREKVMSRKVVLIAPGTSIVLEKDKIISKIKEERAIVITANFIWDDYDVDYAFFSNFKRWEYYGNERKRTKTIITSNLLVSEIDSDYAVNFSDYAFNGNKLYDNCGMMLIKLISGLNPAKILLAGFDGIKVENNFAISRLEKNLSSKNVMQNYEMHKFIGELKKCTDIEFITRSLYEN